MPPDLPRLPRLPGLPGPAALTAVPGLARRDRGARRDRQEHRALVVASGLLDPAWIGLQLGRAVDGPDAAADAVVDADESAGPLSPHPLVELGWARPGQPWLREGVPSLVWWLRARNRRETMAPHPLVDVRAVVRDDPDAIRHAGGPLAAWLDRATPDTLLPVPEGQPPVTLAAARAAALAAQRAHRDLGRTATPPPATTGPGAGGGGLDDDARQGSGLLDPRDAPAVSVLVVAHDAGPLLRASIASLQAQQLTDWEAVVVDDTSTDDTAAVLAGLAHFEPRLVLATRTGDAPAPAEALARGLALARGRHVAFLTPGRTTPPGMLADLVAALDAGRPVVAAGRGAGVLDPARAVADGSLDLDGVALRRDLAVAAGGLDVALGDAAGLDLALRLCDGAGLPVVATEPPADAPRRTTPPPVLLDRHLVDWSAAGSAGSPGTTSVVVVARDGVVATTRWLRAALAEARPDVELVVAGGHPTRAHHVVALTLASFSPAVRCRWVAPAVGAATAANLGLLEATGDRVVVVRGDVQADLADLVRLARALDDPAVALAQPVVVGEDDAVVSAGAAFATSAPRPEPFLAGHAVRDAPAGTTTLAAPLGPVVALRRDLAVRLGGLDPAHTDGLPEVALGLRVAAGGHGRSVLDASVVVRCPAASVVGPARLAATAALLGSTPVTVGPELWDRAGWEVVGLRSEALRPDAAQADGDPLWLPHAVVRPSPPRAERIAQSPPRLRWTIDTAVPAGPGGASWGDQHFAGALRDALERRGQVVAVDAREARLRGGRDHDDVVLVLRGLDRVVPRPGPLHVAWVISHPDLVDATELAAYDAVFAASLSWSARVARTWGVPVAPLLQCTDPGLFHPDRAEPGTGADVLLVGNSRGVMRTSLRAALAAGADVEVHGKGWKEFLGPDRVASLSVPNADLGALYAAAGVVLNDHWEDMRREGFLSNRLFDAGATGARVLSDEIAGVEDVLGPLVRTFAPGADADGADAAGLLADPDAAWGDREARLARAAVIRTEHSFDARAATLLDAVVPLLHP